MGKPPQKPSKPSAPRAPSSPKTPSKPGTPTSPADTRKGKRIEVNLATQKATLYKDSKKVKEMNISSGAGTPVKPETPKGNFTIEKGDIDHVSSTYGNCVKDGESKPKRKGVDCPKGWRFEGAPMPYYQKITAGPLGFHKGELPGYPASHGCIRLSQEDAEFLWKWTKGGNEKIPVKIDGETPKHSPQHPPKHKKR